MWVMTIGAERRGLAVRLAFILALAAISLVGSGCSLERADAARAAAPGARATSAVATAGPTATIRDVEWARRALRILDEGDAATADFHASTEYPMYSLQAQTLRQSAYARFSQALADYQALWPLTQRVSDSTTRDQFVFVFGNIGGFLHPNPDLPGDPGGATLGDRIGRSLQNAVSTSALVRPRLQRLAADH